MVGRGENFGSHHEAVGNRAARSCAQVVQGEHDTTGIGEMRRHAVRGVVAVDVEIEVVAGAIPPRQAAPHEGRGPCRDGVRGCQDHAPYDVMARQGHHIGDVDLDGGPQPTHRSPKTGPLAGEDRRIRHIVVAR